MALEDADDVADEVAVADAELLAVALEVAEELDVAVAELDEEDVTLTDCETDTKPVFDTSADGDAVAVAVAEAVADAELLAVALEVAEELAVAVAELDEEDVTLTDCETDTKPVFDTSADGDAVAVAVAVAVADAELLAVALEVAEELDVAVDEPEALAVDVAVLDAVDEELLVAELVEDEVLVAEALAVAVAVVITDAEIVPESVGEAASADGDEVTENDTTSLADKTLGEEEVDDEGELVMETDLLSRFVTDVEAVAKIENSLLCENRMLEESEAEGEIDPDSETELVLDGISIVFEAFTDTEPVIVPPNLFVGERNELTVCERDIGAVFVAITEVDSIGASDTIALNESRGVGDVDTLYELLPDIEPEPDNDPDDDTEVESELEPLLKADELDEYVSELLPDNDTRLVAEDNNDFTEDGDFPVDFVDDWDAWIVGVTLLDKLEVLETELVTIEELDIDAKLVLDNDTVGDDEIEMVNTVLVLALIDSEAPLLGEKVRALVVVIE